MKDAKIFFRYGFEWRTVLILLFATVIRVAVCEKQTIVEEPQATKALLGANATLRCRVENQKGSVTWMKNGFVLGAHRDLPGFDRYSMGGSSRLGEYHLEIVNVSLADDAAYECQMNAVNEQPFRKSASVRLTVLVKPTKPTLTPSANPIAARENRNVTLTCRTNGSKPAAFISWELTRHADGGGFVRRLNAKGESLIHKRDKLYDVQSTLEYSPQRNDDGSYIACVVQHDALHDRKLVTSSQLRIEYSPKVNISVNSSELLLEGKAAALVCNVDAYPNDNLRYIWHQNGERIQQPSAKRYLNISKLSLKDHHNTVFECKVDNGVGEGTATYVLKMNYKPNVTSQNGTEVYVHENETLTLACKSDGNPPAKIRWYKDNPIEEKAHGEILTVPRFQSSDQGTYICKAMSDGNLFEPASLSFNVFRNGPPNVEIRSMVHAKKGAEYFKLQCSVKSPPKTGTKIAWYRGDQLISVDDHYSWNEKIVDTNSTHNVPLTIRKVDVSDFGLYNCTASNSIGSRSGVTHLVQAEEFPTYAILGVAGGCMAILALALALIVVNRKYLCRSKSSHSGDDHSDLTVKMDVLDNGPPLCYPDAFTASMDAQEQFYKDYVAVPQDNPDFDLLPPPYGSYYTAAATGNSTFGKGNLPNGNSLILNGHYGHQLANGHLTHMTYLDDSVSPATTTTTMASANMGNGQTRPLSPLLTPTSSKMTVVTVPSPAPHSYANGHYQPSHYQPTYSTFSQQPAYHRYGGTSLAPVDLLSGHASGLTLTNGHSVAGGNCIMYADPSFSVYHPLTTYGDQPPYHPSGVHSLPLETVHEVPTPDDQQQQQMQQSHSMRSSLSDGATRCGSQMSTHV